MLIKAQRRAGLGGLKQSVLLLSLMVIFALGQEAEGGEAAVVTEAADPVGEKLVKEWINNDEEPPQEFDITANAQEKRQPPPMRSKQKPQHEMNREIKEQQMKIANEQKMVDKRLEKELKKKNEKIEKLKADGDFEKAAALQKEIDDEKGANDQFLKDKKEKLLEKRAAEKEKKDTKAKNSLKNKREMQA